MGITLKNTVLHSRIIGLSRVINLLVRFNRVNLSNREKWDGWIKLTARGFSWHASRFTWRWLNCDISCLTRSSDRSRRIVSFETILHTEGIFPKCLQLILIVNEVVILVTIKYIVVSLSKEKVNLWTFQRHREPMKRPIQWTTR